MKENFEVSVGYILRDEGGYAERENEPGGAGNRGISYTLFKEMWAKEGKGIPTFADLKALDDTEAARLYQKFIFPQIAFDDMPSGLDYVMINTAVMQGPTGATRILQESFNFPFLEITGKLNQPTWDAIHGAPNPYKLVGQVLILQCKYKMNDPRVGDWVDSKGNKMKGFGPGWGNRSWRLWNRAIQLIRT